MGKGSATSKKNKETLQLFEENTSGLGMAMDHQYNLYRSEVYIDEEKDAFAYISRYHVQWVYEDGKK
ncbi:hypothetical protein [Neobacillus massiliamazoniensis]|uniref:hypothetical protein n=1 Tax=Neobacillus massiliamazoniensis TaxID=1499688 RepID=UPI000AA09BE7|nr:hypothetical protein [Neobacillus massiliamazoniensis]